jgi:hypothetical protein
MPDPARPPRIRHPLERLDQRQRHRPGTGMIIRVQHRQICLLEHGNDRGDYDCGHGHPDAIKDFDTLMITPRSCPHLRL